MNIFSNELKLSLLLSLNGVLLQFFLLKNGLKEQKNLNCNLWNVILSRELYKKQDGYTTLFLFALADFYITLVLLLYFVFMIMKFIGFHFSKNKKEDNYYWSDILLIITMCLFIRLYSFINSYINI